MQWNRGQSLDDDWPITRTSISAVVVPSCMTRFMSYNVFNFKI